MDIEALTKFFTKEINNSSSGINLSNEEFEDVWNNCEKVNNYSYSQPHIKDFPKEVTCGVKGLS